jgi:thiamine transport system substrate-binding protein
MEERMIRLSLTAAGLTLALACPLAAGEKPVLNIYTYDSFVADWGPGPAVEQAFEAICGCDLQFTAAGDGAALLARLRLEGDRSKADIVLGLDTMLTAAAAETGLFAPHGKTPVVDIPNPLDESQTWDDPLFLPFDWGYFAFVYDKTRLKRVPRSFEDLIAAPDDLKIVIEDPRTSTPGLGLLYWVKRAYGDRAGEIWTGLAPHILTVTPGWSEAYGLFLDGEADLVLSYTTSPNYHAIAEQDMSKAAAIFTEGHYLQIEVAGKLASSTQPELADRFLDFMLSDAFQALIPMTNWMYPAITPADGLPEGFTNPVDPKQALILAPDAALALRDAALDEWLNALSR